MSHKNTFYKSKLSHLRVLLGSVCLSGILLLTGCSEEPQQAASKQTATSAKKDNSANPDADSAKQNNLYDFEGWMKKTMSVHGYSATDIAHVVGKAKNKLDRLDYNGNPAKAHRYMENGVVFFDIIDSNEFIEINWFKAIKDDIDVVKNSAKKATHMAHQSARIILGDTGGKVVEEMVTAEDGKAQTVHAQVTEAICQSFFCRLVIKKSTSSESDLANQVSTNQTEENNADANKTKEATQDSSSISSKTKNP